MTRRRARPFSNESQEGIAKELNSARAEIAWLRARVRELEDAAATADQADRERMDHAQYQSTVSA
jgi:BMFP domain-containing protein YqiC